MWYIGLGSELLNYVLYGLVGWHENHMFVVQPVLFVKSHMIFVVTRYLLLLIEVHVFVVFSLLLVKVYALYKDRQQPFELFIIIWRGSGEKGVGVGLVLHICTSN